MKQYITGRTWYNEEKELWFTDVGTANKNGGFKDLLFASCGVTALDSQEMAKIHVNIFNLIDSKIS
jgi:hypothetical protein